MNRPRQLALALPHTESFAREDFLPGPCNEAALALIERWPDWPARAAVLAGPEGAGKSHLGAIWAQAAGARILAARGLAETELPQALATDALLLEDLAPDEIDERALFHLLNLVREHQAYLLITSRVMPVNLTALGDRLWGDGRRQLAMIRIRGRIARTTAWTAGF